MKFASQRIEKTLPAWSKAALCAVCTLLFFGVAYFVLYRGQDLWHLWLPNATNNDEVFYNRQLVGVLADGQPRGVFGYNEQRAHWGHFATWGPLVFYLYALPGLLVGSGVNTMFWCNLLFAAAGWLVFAAGSALSWKRQLAFGLAVLAACMPLQLVFSGAAEGLHYGLVFCILGGSCALRRGFHAGWYACLVAACGLETLLRAYTGVLWVFPLALLWPTRRRLACVTAGWAALSLGGYFCLSRWFSAPYFSNSGVDLTAGKLLLRGQLTEALSYTFTRLALQFRYLWEGLISTSATAQPRQQAVAFWLVTILLVMAGFTVAWDLFRRPVVLRLLAMGCALTGQLAILLFYTTDSLVRHAMLFFVLLLAALLIETRLAAAVVFCLLAMQLWLPYRRWAVSLPTYDAAMDCQLQTLQAALEQAEQQNQSEDPWDHTVAYDWTSQVFHGYLYGVPAGMGIQFDSSRYLASEETEIRSRFVITSREGPVQDRLLRDGWTEWVATEDLVVYQRPEEG